MAWIESHQAIGNHPKTIMLAEELNVKLPTAVGYLHYLWWWALDYAHDGKIGRFDPKVIAHACQWIGRPQIFLDGLVAAGFVDETDDGRVIHDWYEYAGSLLERRARDRDRKRTSRGQAEDVRDTVNGTSGGLPADVVQTSLLAREGARNRTNQPDRPDQPDRPGRARARPDNSQNNPQWPTGVKP